MSNPFSQKAGKTRPASTSQSPSTSSSRPQGTNPWSSRVTSRPMSSTPSSTARRKLKPRSSSRAVKQPSGYTKTPVRTGPDVTGVSVGDRVRLTWEVDRAYFIPGSGEFVGVVTVLNDWITVVNNDHVKFHYPLSTLSGCEVLGVDRQRRIKRRG